MLNLLSLYLVCSSLAAVKSLLATDGSWNRYLLEFRGILPAFRVSELQHALSFVLESDAVATQLVKDIEYVIVDDEVEGQPLCGYIKLPNETVASAVASRCGCLRSVIEVWGEGKTVEIVRDETLSKFNDVIRPIFPIAKLEEEKERNSWKIVFRRFGRAGRSGLDPQGKRDFLQVFNPILKNLEGDVNLTSPSHQLILLEDWHSFQAQSTLQGGSLPDYTPLHSFFGRIVGFGSEIQTDFSLNRRPFLGTTTMAPLPAHLCAVAARVGINHVVLDPFCGTGSILVSCAALGAKVVGSDLDADCLGLADHEADNDGTFEGFDGIRDAGSGVVSIPPLRERDRSKNRRLNNNRANSSKRSGAPVISKPLPGTRLSTRDNMAFYNLEGNLVGLKAMDVRDWLQDADEVESGCVQKFDAIVTDPPYNRRERAMKSVKDDDHTTSPLFSHDADTDSYSEGCAEVIRALCDVASKRLVLKGRLVFWYPTDAFVSSEHVEALLRQTISEDAQRALVLESLTCEKLHDKLWRWLVVFINL